MKILDNLWQVGGAEYTTVEDAAAYLVCFGEKAALIDAGCGNDREALFDCDSISLSRSFAGIFGIRYPSWFKLRSFRSGCPWSAGCFFFIQLSNREDYHRSLKFMLGLKADILCEGHFGIYRGKENISRFVQSFL